MRTPRSALSLAALTATIALALAPSDGRAFTPDYEGEHGVELSLGLGVGGFTENGVHLLQTVDSTSRDNPGIVSPGANLRAAVGYRPRNLFSAGLSFQYQYLGSSPLGGVETSANAAAIGAYARFYPMALLEPSWDAQPRVVFNGLLDRRRLDPWVSLGFEFYQSFAVRAQNPGSSAYTSWTRHSVGIPVVVGAEVRLLPALAAGLSFGFTPWIGGGFDTETHFTFGGNEVTTQNACHRSDPADHSTCASPVGANVSWFLGISARYTLTL